MIGENEADASEERRTGECRRCGRSMEWREPDFGTPFWTCPIDHEPPVIVLAPRQFRYAFAYVRVDFDNTFGDMGVDPFGGAENGRTIPSWTALLKDRLETVYQSKLDDRRPEQPGLGRWSG